VSEQKLTELEAQQRREVSALNESAAIANKRYRGGLASYYEVLEAQQLLFPAEIALSQTRRDRLLAVVQLYKALGGGWRLTDSQWTKGHP
jgi:outer membrane protein, multidrug efflux system